MATSISIEPLTDHVVILNVNEKVRRIIEEIELGSAGAPPDIVVMIQDHHLWQCNSDWHPDAELPGRRFIVDGCPAEPDDLAAVHVDRARAAVILADPRQGELADAHSTLVAVAIERRCPQVHTVMELIASVNRVHLRSTEVNEVVCLGEISEQLIAQCCITPGIARVFSDLLHAHPGTTQVFVVELPQALAGMTYRQVARRAIESRAPFVLVGFARDGEVDGPRSRRRSIRESAAARHCFVLNPRPGVHPGKDSELRGGDRLVVIGYSRPDMTLLLNQGG